MAASSIPTSCRALQLEKPKEKGPRNVASVNTVDVPKAAQGYVLVKMHAAGFNRRDEWSMVGQYPGLTFTNSTMGCDGCGVVVRADQQTIQPTQHRVANDMLPPHPQGLVLLNPTRGWQSDPHGPEASVPGTPAASSTNGLGGRDFGILGNTKPTNGVGCMADYVQVEQDQVVHVPAHMTAVQAAALPCGGVTAYRALFSKAEVQFGQNILITGIGGGVALLALQFAVAAGANVYVTGGSQDKVQRAVDLGAKAGVLYRDAEWPKQLAQLVKQHSPKRPFLDAVIDSAGGQVPAQAAKAGLRVGGRIVCYGMTAAPSMAFTMREVLRHVDLLSSTMGSAQEFRQMVRFVDQHKIVPVIDTVLQGLDQAQRGFPLLQDAEKRSGGKVILQLVQQAEVPKSKL